MRFPVLHAVLYCAVGTAGTGCAALVVGAAAGAAGGGLNRLDDLMFRSGPMIDTTYQADVSTITSLVSQVVTEHTARSQFALTKSTVKDEPTDREVRLHSVQGSRLVFRVQDAKENGATAARLRIWAHVETDRKLIGANRRDEGAANEFGEIVGKVRQETAKRKLKILRDTRPEPIR